MYIITYLHPFIYLYIHIYTHTHTCNVYMKLHHVKRRTVCCSALQCGAVRCSAVQCVAELKCAPRLFRSHVCAFNMPETRPTVTYE